MALHVHRSNRLEKLAERLAEIVAAPLADPFARECIAVQGPGMERWLASTLSRAHGIWANPWFPFPRALIELFLTAVIGPAPEPQPFHPDALVWRIAALVPTQRDDPAFRDVASYLTNDPLGERLIDLSQRLAETFDQYVIYRPDLVLRWERGEEDHFQAKLWRALLCAEGAVHLAHRMVALERALASGQAIPDDPTLPERISLFGISTLPPAFLGVLARIAAQRDVHLFVLSPTELYFGDLDRTVAKRGDLHGFLAQLGRVSREFVDEIEKHPYLEDPEPLFEPPEPTSMLRALQSDLVTLTARARRMSGFDAPRPLPERDDSLRVHVCHSAVRELEVLRDHLRARFEADHTLEARDVVVFTPDIERYAPAIEAVFAEGSVRDLATIPFRIADRRTVRASEIAEAFFALIELLGSRLHLSDVLDLLHRACVRDRFEIAESEIDQVQHWLVTAGARWAVDATHRASFEQPAFGENSLRFALDRLLVGYAARDGEQRELYDVLPCSDVEGRDALLLGKLARYLETLFDWVGRLAAPAPPAQHARALGELLAAMLSDSGELGIEHHALRSALGDLASEAEQAAFQAPVTLRTIAQLLAGRLDRGRANVGFLAGGVTFCEPVPMRAIPFRVVCLLGMNDEDFPRSVKKPAFDLMAATPRPGDRSLRDDDRQLFLEALLSARDALHVSYVGRSAQDAAERPASVLVDQLLRLCDQHFEHDAQRTLSLGFEGTASRTITTEHALHRFDVRYFRGDDAALFSYDARALAAARAARAPKATPQPFVAAPLIGALSDEPRLTLSLEALTRFFRKPQETFLKERLKIYLPRELDEVADREPISLDALERFRLADELLAQRDTHDAGERARLLVKAGRLAPGSVGGAQLEEFEALVDEVVAAAPIRERLPDRDLLLELPSARVYGRLDGLTDAQRVVRSVGKLHAARRLSVFIEHLALCASGPAPQITRLVGRDKKTAAEVVEFVPIASATAAQLLDQLVLLYRLGMSMPLPLFLDAAEAYMSELGKSGDEASALLRAQLKVLPTGKQSARPDDPHVREVFHDEQLRDLGALFASDGETTLRFTELAEAVLGPMLRYTREDAS